jgi:zinc transporter
MSESLIHARVFGSSGRPRSLSKDEVRAWQPGQGLLWAHLDARHEDTKEWLKTTTDLPKVVVSALLAEETRPRSYAIGDGLLLVLRGVNLNPGANPEDMVSIRLWVDQHRVVSTCRRHLLSVGDVVTSHSEKPIESTGDLLVRLTDRLTERMSDVIDDLDEVVAKLEATVLDEPDVSMRSALADLRRDAIALRRYLGPQREALGRLQGEALPWLVDFDRLRLREVHDRVTRHVEDLDAIRERAVVIQAELNNYLTDQVNKRMYVLSVVAALFLPLGFLTGLLGVNVGGIPGADSPYGFAVFGLILVVLVAFQLWYFIRRHWF